MLSSLTKQPQDLDLRLQPRNPITEEDDLFVFVAIRQASHNTQPPPAAGTRPLGGKHDSLADEIDRDRREICKSHCHLGPHTQVWVGATITGEMTLFTRVKLR